MKTKFFACEQLPNNFDILVATNKLSFIISKPVIDIDENNKTYYLLEYNIEELIEKYLLDVLTFYGFTSITLLDGSNEF